MLRVLIRLPQSTSNILIPAKAQPKQEEQLLINKIPFGAPLLVRQWSKDLLRPRPRLRPQS